MNALSWLYSLGGLHVCASLFLGVFTVNFMMNLKSSLHCPNCQGVGRGAGGARRYYLSAPRSMGSFESQSISFEAGRVVRIRKQQFRVLVWHTRNHLVLTFIIELWELARRIGIFITWGVKEVHSIKKKKFLDNALCNFRLTLSMICLYRKIRHKWLRYEFFLLPVSGRIVVLFAVVLEIVTQGVCLCVTTPRATSRKTAPSFFS